MIHMPKETTYLPVDGPLSIMGAAGFLALLAYPDALERRDKFIDAVKAWHLKNAIQQGYPRSGIIEEFRIVRNRKIDSALDNAFITRINKRRLPAAEMGTMLLSKARSIQLVPEDYLNPNSANKYLLEIGRLSSGSPLTSKDLDTHLALGNKRPLGQPNAVMELCKFMAQKIFSYYESHIDSKQISDSLEERANKVAHEVWAESKPVLHLGIAFRGNILEKQSGTNKVDPLWFLTHPKDWLQKTIESAEAMRQVLISHDSLNIHENDTIQLLPANN